MYIRQFFKDSICFFYPRDIQKNFWKAIDFVEKLEMTQITGDGGLVSYVIMR